MDQELEVQEQQEAPPPPLNERPVDGPGSGRGELRKQLEKSVDGERTAREKREAKVPQEKEKKPARAKAPNHQETEEPDETPEAVEGGEQEQQQGKEQDQEQVEPAPEGISKEAQAEWAKTPAPVRAAVIKRLADSAKGVEELKRKYSDIDQVIAPRADLFRRHGHTAASAVNQMFAWFDALAANPQQAFPALAQSFKFDLNSVGQPQKTNGKGEQEQQQEETPPWQQAIEALKQEFGQQFGSLHQNFQQANMVKTQEVLENWSKGKPYFEEVRQAMAHMIGSGMVPPLPNGGADLDKAYDMAIYAVPEIRAKINADQEAARQKELKEKADKERKAQQELADKARRASGSLNRSAPGEPPAPGKRSKGKSVRESIQEAREELSER